MKQRKSFSKWKKILVYGEKKEIIEQIELADDEQLKNPPKRQAKRSFKQLIVKNLLNRQPIQQRVRQTKIAPMNNFILQTETIFTTPYRNKLINEKSDASDDKLSDSETNEPIIENRISITITTEPE